MALERHKVKHLNVTNSIVTLNQATVTSNSIVTEYQETLEGDRGRKEDNSLL